LFDGATIISHVNGLRHRNERVFDDDESERQIRGFVAALEAASTGENAGPNPPVYLAAYRTLLSGFDDAAFRAPTLHVAGGSCVSLGDITIELHHFGPAHTDADLIVWIPSEHLLVAGDAIMGHAYAPVAHPVHGGSVTGLVATAWEVRRLVTADTRVLPGHGEIGGLDLVQRQITYVEALLAAVREARARGMSLDEAKAALQVEAFAASLLYEFVHPGHVESAWHETLAQR
jgi:glyoxylase-like metal-dependent hydrolase (beta-lactamase superfamily II)